jgi:hypothetical protein
MGVKVPFSPVPFQSAKQADLEKKQLIDFNFHFQMGSDCKWDILVKSSRTTSWSGCLAAYRAHQPGL